MRQTKTRMELFSFYDHSGIAAHLEAQAKQGWMLEKIGNWGWKYRRIEPREVKFYVTYFPKASAYDPAPSEREQVFRAYCEEAGWKLVASNAQLQVFFCAQADPVPIETDALLQVENIHAAAKRSSLVSHWVLGIMGVLQMMMWLTQFVENPLEILADYGGWFRGICWPNLILLCAVELLAYYRWHEKAVKTARENGTLHPTRSHRVFQTVSLITVTGSLLIYAASIQSRRVMTTMLFSFGYIVLLMLLVNGCRLLLKKWKVSANVNRVVTLTVDVVLAFGMMGLMVWGVMKMDIQDRKVADTYEYRGRVWEVYADELPLCVEDLLEVDPDGYSKTLDVKETLLAAVYDGAQDTRFDWETEQPDMNYRLAVAEVPALTAWLWDDWVEAYPVHGNTLVEIDPAPWNAQEAYREYMSPVSPGYTWLIRWEDRFIRLTAYWELTEEQMGVIAKCCLNCAD